MSSKHTYGLCHSVCTTQWSPSWITPHLFRMQLTLWRAGGGLSIFTYWGPGTLTTRGLVPKIKQMVTMKISGAEAGAPVCTEPTGFGTIAHRTDRTTFKTAKERINHAKNTPPKVEHALRPLVISGSMTSFYRDVSHICDIKRYTSVVHAGKVCWTNMESNKFAYSSHNTHDLARLTENGV